MRRLRLALVAVWGAATIALGQVETPAPTADTPLTLAQCIELALQRHPDIASAQAALQAARAQAVISASQQYPQVGLDWAARVSQSLGRPVNVGGGVIQVQSVRSTQRDASATLNWTIFQSGLRDQVSQAKTQAVAAVYGLTDVQRQLTFQVQTSYYTVLATRQQLTVAMKALATSERHLDLVQARLDQGQVPESDTLPIKTEVARARLAAVQAESNLGTAEAGLRALLVLPPGTTLELADVLPKAATQPELARLLELAEANRPDIAEQKLNVRAAALGTKVAETNAGIALSAAGQADYGRHTGTTGESWSVRVGATYPLFDAGASRGEVTVARARETQVREQLANTILLMRRDVETAALQLRQAQTAIEVAVTATDEAAKSLTAAEVRYREGLAIIIEVTDAQLALVQAELAELRARYDYATALADLSRAVGIPPSAAAGDAP